MRVRTAAAAGMAAFALTAAGCGGDDNKSASPAPPPQQEMQGAETGAATLRATLTALLTDHVYQAGVAVTTGLGAGLDSPQFKAAAGTLDKNSIALSKAIESVYGADAGKAFLGLWRSHIGMFVDYTKAKAAGDAAAAAKAERDLDGYRQDFGAFIASANPNLPKAAVAADLKPHVQTLIATIDAAVAKSPTVFDKLAAAAKHMPMTATILAGGIAKQFPDKFSGSVEDGAAALRAGLTSLLEDHVYQAGIAISTGVNAGLSSPAFKAAAATLDKNSVALSKAIGGVYGAEAGKAFLGLWRSHIGMFVDYTKAKATKNTAAAEKALARLDKYRADFGAFLESANPNLSKEAVANELKPHVETVAATIRAVVAQSPKTYERLAEAAAHMPHTATTLAGGIVKQFPDKFTAAASGHMTTSGGHTTTAAAPSPATTAGDGATVAIKTFIYRPDPLRVTAGTAVTWDNQDAILHTVTAGRRGHPTGLFDKKLDEGDRFTYTFAKAGTYPYVCTIHQAMDGEVIVS